MDLLRIIISIETLLEGSLIVNLLLIQRIFVSYCRLMIFSCKLDFGPEEEGPAAGGVNLHFRCVSWWNKFASNFSVFHVQHNVQIYVLFPSFRPT